METETGIECVSRLDGLGSKFKWKLEKFIIGFFVKEFKKYVDGNGFFKDDSGYVTSIGTTGVIQ